MFYEKRYKNTFNLLKNKRKHTHTKNTQISMTLNLLPPVSLLIYFPGILCFSSYQEFTPNYKKKFHTNSPFGSLGRSAAPACIMPLTSEEPSQDTFMNKRQKI